MIRTAFPARTVKKVPFWTAFLAPPYRQMLWRALLSEFDGKVNFVPYITASESTLIERLSGRWTCKAQGHVFHEKYNPPQKPGVCDFDASELYQRDDDKAETVTRRIQVYFEQTAPLIAYYRSAWTPFGNRWSPTDRKSHSRLYWQCSGR